MMGLGLIVAGLVLAGLWLSLWVFVSDKHHLEINRIGIMVNFSIAGVLCATPVLLHHLFFG